MVRKYPYYILPFSLLSFSFLPVSLFLLLSTSCIVPPRELKPSVLPEEELELVSTIKRGQDYALGGRAELAENEFRKILVTRPDLIIAHNDLGYAFLAQEKYEDAEKSFREALKISPSAITPRLNLAKTLYRKGAYPESLKEYKEALRWHEINEQASRGKDISSETRKLSPSELAETYRNISIIHYTMGNIPEAITASTQAKSYERNADQVGNHVRLLLATGHLREAYKESREFVLATKESAPNAIVLDYAVASYAVGQFGISKEAFQKVLIGEGGDDVDKNIARLGYVLLTEKEKKKSEQQLLSKAFAEDNPEICEPELMTQKTYIPERVRADLQRAVTMLCNDGNESIL